MIKSKIWTVLSCPTPLPTHQSKHIGTNRFYLREFYFVRGAQNILAWQSIHLAVQIVIPVITVILFHFIIMLAVGILRLNWYPVRLGERFMHADASLPCHVQYDLPLKPSLNCTFSFYTQTFKTEMTLGVQLNKSKQFLHTVKNV